MILREPGEHVPDQLAARTLVALAGVEKLRLCSVVDPKLVGAVFGLRRAEPNVLFRRAAAETHQEQRDPCGDHRHGPRGINSLEAEQAAPGVLSLPARFTDANIRAVPEYPDITVYIESLERRVTGQPLEDLRFANPFVLRSVSPAPSELLGKKVIGFSRIGKRIVFHLEDELYIVLHLMIAGRLKWLPPKAKIPGRIGLVAFDFPNGSLILTEAGTKRRASLHLARGKEALQAHDPGGVEIADLNAKTFAAQLRKERHTLKRTLTDPRFFSGIGNAYSDEILHRAKMSPVRMTTAMSDEECTQLFKAVKSVLKEWTGRLRKEAGDNFPENVTAFREEMAAHGKYGKPCPTCGSPIQRIVHAENETNYCATCQTEGRLLADRSLSRLLKEDWPKTLDELEQRKAAK